MVDEWKDVGIWDVEEGKIKATLTFEGTAAALLRKHMSVFGFSLTDSLGMLMAHGCQGIERRILEELHEQQRRRGVAGDRCEPGNECGRLGCEECQK